MCVVMLNQDNQLTDLFYTTRVSQIFPESQLTSYKVFLGLVKLKLKIKNAFEKPFRNQTTTSLSISQTRKSVVRESSQAEGVHHEQPSGHHDVSRESRSPIWDIELDEGELPSDI